VGRLASADSICAASVSARLVALSFLGAGSDLPVIDLSRRPIGSSRRRLETAAVSIRLAADNLAVIDQLVEAHGATSLSQLMTAALRATLSGHYQFTF